MLFRSPAEDDILTKWIEMDDDEEGGTKNHLEYAIDELDEEERRLLYWLFVERCTQAECARRAGISVVGIKKRRQRLLQKLREVLEGMDTQKVGWK